MSARRPYWPRSSAGMKRRVEREGLGGGGVAAVAALGSTLVVTSRIKFPTGCERSRASAVEPRQSRGRNKGLLVFLPTHARCNNREHSQLWKASGGSRNLSGGAVLVLRAPGAPTALEENQETLDTVVGLPSAITEAPPARALCPCVRWQSFRKKKKRKKKEPS